MPLLYLPTELLTEVFGHLVDDHRALRASALVITLSLPGWVEGAMFYPIEENRRADGFLGLLLASPHLALYVVRLQINLAGWSAYWAEVLPSVITILRKLTCLCDLHVHQSIGIPCLSWDVFPQLWHTTIIETIQDRSLDRISLQKIEGVPAVTFLKSSIRYLSLTSVTWEDSLGSETAPIEPPALKSLHITLLASRDSLSAIDGLLSKNSPFNISELQSIRITIKLDIWKVDENHLSQFRKLLANVAGTLKHLWLHCDPEAEFMDLASRPYPQLQTIGRRFRIRFTHSGSLRSNPVPFLLKTIPNAGSTIAGVGFHLILELIIFMADPWALNEDVGSWAELAQVLTPLPCRLTISIWSHLEFRTPDLISRFESQFSEMRSQRRLTMLSMSSSCTNED